MDDNGAVLLVAGQQEGGVLGDQHAPVLGLVAYQLPVESATHGAGLFHLQGPCDAALTEGVPALLQCLGILYLPQANGAGGFLLFSVLSEPGRERRGQRRRRRGQPSCPWGQEWGCSERRWAWTVQLGVLPSTPQSQAAHELPLPLGFLQLFLCLFQEPLESLPGQVEPIGRGWGRALWGQLEHIDVRSLAIYEDGHSVLLPKPGQPGWGLLAQEVPHRLGDGHFALAGASTGCHSGQDERHCPRGERDSGVGSPQVTDKSASYFRPLPNPALPLFSSKPTPSTDCILVFYFRPHLSHSPCTLWE